MPTGNINYYSKLTIKLMVQVQQWTKYKDGYFSVRVNFIKEVYRNKVEDIVLYCFLDLYIPLAVPKGA